MSRSTATLCALLILSAILTGCASTTDRLAYPAQCPKPEQPDDRLVEDACAYTPITLEMTQLEREAATIANNKCARQVRDRYVELQRWVRGRVQ